MVKEGDQEYFEEHHPSRLSSMSMGMGMGMDGCVCLAFCCQHGTDALLAVVHQWVAFFTDKEKQAPSYYEHREYLHSRPHAGRCGHQALSFEDALKQALTKAKPLEVALKNFRYFEEPISATHAAMDSTQSVKPSEWSTLDNKACSLANGCVPLTLNHCPPVP